MFFNRSYLRPAFLVLCLSCLARPAYGFDVEVIESPKLIQAWFVEDHRLPIVDLTFSIRHGTLNDPEGKEGLVKLMTGLLDEGAGDYDHRDFARALEDKAIQLSFSAGNYGITGRLRTLSDSLPDALHLLALAINQPRFDEEPFEKVRQQLISRVRSNAKDPGALAQTALARLAFGDSVFSRPDEGTEESLTRLTTKDVRDLYHKLFTRHELIVSLVGDISPDDARKALDQLFGALPEQTTLPDHGDPLIIEPGSDKKDRVRLTKVEVPQSEVHFILPGPALKDDDYFAAMIVNAILGGNPLTSRLFVEVRNKRGLAYSVSTSMGISKEKSHIYGFLGVSNENVGAAIDLIRKEIKRLAEEGPTDQEFEDSKQAVMSAYENNFTSNQSIAGQLLGQQSLGLTPDYSKTRNDTVAKVTKDQVRQAAATYLAYDPLFAVAGNPDKLEP